METISITNVQNVKLKSSSHRETFTGTLYLTLPSVFFITADSTKEEWIGTSMIRQIERGPNFQSGASLILKCKDYRCFHFVILSDGDRQKIMNTLYNILRLRSTLQSLPCFTYQPRKNTRRDIGWDCFDLREEYRRMGVPNEKWFHTSINMNYETCDTYPCHLFVPTLNRKILEGSSQFRSRNRLPVLTYLHRNGKSSLCRSSQPLAGLRAQCHEDQDLIAAILSANQGSQTLYIVDTRPMANAFTNRVQGKGWENDKHYKNIVCQFFPIHNIHVMRASVERLSKACDETDNFFRNYWSEVDSSSWLSHIKCIFDTALFIVKTMNDGSSVLVHCSDGWDRTAQTCALAQLILEPRYRTIEGFLTLIDKDWLSFGHKFTDRCGQLYDSDSQEVSPVFSQFLECVWQLTVIFPREFEFNEKLLLELHDGSQNGLYGNFVGNCLKDRVDMRVRERSFSFWACHSSSINDYFNQFYAPDSSSSCLKIDRIIPQMFSVWHGLYSRGRITSPHWTETDPQECVAQLRTHNHLLRSHQTWLTQQIQALCQRLQRSLPDTLQQMSLSPTSYSLLEDSFTGSANEEKTNESNERDPLTSLSSFDSSPSADDRKQSLVLIKESENGVIDHPLAPTAIQQELSVSVPISVTLPRQVSEDDSGSILDPLSSLSSSSVIVGESIKSKLTLLTKERINSGLKSIAVDWSSYKSSLSCHECRKLFDTQKRKIHCCMCGQIHCRLCTRIVKRVLGLASDSEQVNGKASEMERGISKSASIEVALCLKCFKEHRNLCESLEQTS